MTTTNSQLIQAMPLIEGKVNLTSGTAHCNELIHCAADGSITIVWDTGVSATVAMTVGQDYAFTGNVTIVSGTFHIS